MEEINCRIADLFIDALNETVSIMTGIFLEASLLEEQRLVSSDIVGAMMLPGKKNALLVISTERESASVLVSYMTGIDINDQKEYELYDGMAEIVNMVAGMTKAKLENSDHSFRLTSPFTVVGNKLLLITKNSIEKYEHVLENGEVRLKLALYYM